MTPSVALRALYEQMRSFDEFRAAGRPVGLYTHFVGPITPPARRARRAIGDPVVDAVAAYASKVGARAGMLTACAGADEGQRLTEYGRLTRMLFTVEHALAIDLGRATPDIPLRHREVSARGVLAVASYWCDRDELTNLSVPGTNPLLGGRPHDAMGAVLWEHAVLSLTPPRRGSGSGGLGNDNDVIDLTIGINLSPSAA